MLILLKTAEKASFYSLVEVNKKASLKLFMRGFAHMLEENGLTNSFCRNADILSVEYYVFLIEIKFP